MSACAARQNIYERPKRSEADRYVVRPVSAPKRSPTEKETFCATVEALQYNPRSPDELLQHMVLALPQEVGVTYGLRLYAEVIFNETRASIAGAFESLKGLERNENSCSK